MEEMNNMESEIIDKVQSYSNYLKLQLDNAVQKKNYYENRNLELEKIICAQFNSLRELEEKLKKEEKLNEQIKKFMF